MKSFIGFLLVAFVSWQVSYAQNTEQPQDTIIQKPVTGSSDIVFPVVIEPVQMTMVPTPICLGRHHIAFSWYGYSRALNDRLNTSYIDARNGESGFFNYRYSFSEHIDLAVDGRGFINNVDDDSMKTNITAKVFYSGFGVRYTFDKQWVLFPYLQGSIYQVTADISSASKHNVGDNPELFWGVEGDGWGGGINGGIDIRLGKLISIPVDISYIYSNPKMTYSYIVLYDGYYKAEYLQERSNMSSFLISVGVSFNWGRVK